MQPDIDYLVVTTGQTDLSFFPKMNIRANTIIANQTDQYSIIHAPDCVMITTPTKGVGINRNIGLALTEADYSLIVDDDMVFYDNANSIIRRALNNHPDADIIIFNFDYIRDDNTAEPRMTLAGKISMFNCLRYGICCTLVKNSAIKKHNIFFSNLFGGGCIYSCGEDSLFFWNCINAGMRMYSYIEPIGKNIYRESTWFKGYNEKYFYDKGAWIACAFGKLKHLFKWYFVFRLQPFSTLSIWTVMKLINSGIKGFENLDVFSEEPEK